MKWEDVPKIPEGSEGVVVQVRAPACPVDNAANWRQLIVSIALVVFMGWLLVEAVTTDPIPWIPALLALAGLTGGLVMFAGLVKSRLSRR